MRRVGHHARTIGRSRDYRAGSDRHRGQVGAVIADDEGADQPHPGLGLRAGDPRIPTASRALRSGILDIMKLGFAGLGMLLVAAAASGDDQFINWRTDYRGALQEAK